MLDYDRYSAKEMIETVRPDAKVIARLGRSYGVWTWAVFDPFGC